MTLKDSSNPEALSPGDRCRNVGFHTSIYILSDCGKIHTM